MTRTSETTHLAKNHISSLNNQWFTNLKAHRRRVLQHKDVNKTSLLKPHYPFVYPQWFFRSLDELRGKQRMCVIHQLKLFWWLWPVLLQRPCCHLLTWSQKQKSIVLQFFSHACQSTAAGKLFHQDIESQVFCSQKTVRLRAWCDEAWKL